MEVNGEILRIDEYKPKMKTKVYILIDRLTTDDSKDAISRLTDSAEAAMYEGDGSCFLRFYLADGSTKKHSFSNLFTADGITFEEPSDQMFSFNSSWCLSRV